MSGRPPTEDERPALLKTSEVARMLRVARSTVVSWAYRGLLAHTRTPGGQLRFYRDQVEAILAAGKPPDETPDQGSDHGGLH